MVGPNTPGDRPDSGKSEAFKGGEKEHLHKPRFETDIGDQAGQAMSETRRGARDMGRQIKESARSAADRARRQATGTAEKLRHQGEDLLDQQKGWAVQELEHCAHASRAAAQKLRDEQDANVAMYADFAADRLDDLAGYVRDRNVGDMISDLGGIARRHPELFFGGMFVLGLLGARFLKASSRPSYDEDYGYQSSYAYGYESDYGDFGDENFDRSMPVARGTEAQSPFPATSQASGTSGAPGTSGMSGAGSGGMSATGVTQTTSTDISGGTPGSNLTGPGAGVKPYASEQKNEGNKNKGPGASPTSGL